jgi:hypothetical protein
MPVSWAPLIALYGRLVSFCHYVWLYNSLLIPDRLWASLRVILRVTAAHLVLKFSLHMELCVCVRDVLSWSLVSVRGQIYIFHISVLLATGWTGWTTEESEFESRYLQEFSLLHVVQAGSGAHPASYTMVTGGKAAGAWSWPLTSS